MKGSRKERLIKAKKRRLFVIFLMITVIIISGSISHRMKFLRKDVVEAKSVTETLEKIGGKSLISAAVSEEIKLIEEEEARKIIQEEKRKREEQLKLEEERKLAEKKANGKIAYLTFDDGPSEKVTPEILDILSEYDIKATFFVVGNMAEKYPEILKRTYEEGHKIGNHSYSHNYGYIYKNSTNFLKDLEKADRVLKDILGEEFDSKIMRFPGGSFGKHKAPMKKAVTDAGYQYIDWNALNGDAEGLNMSKRQLINRLKETTRNKKNLVILMHDTDAKETTVKALREILDYLISQGYAFGVIDENY